MESADPELIVASEDKRNLHRASVVAGSMQPREYEAVVVVHDSKDGTLKTKSIMTDHPEALVRVLIEVLANAVDNKSASIHKAHPNATKPTEVTIEPYRITVRNFGCSVPVERKVYRPDHGEEWRPYVSFGVTSSSTNYGKNINTTSYDEGIVELPYPVSGRNGLGAKLANILSLEFTVIAADGKLRYEQTFRKNMSEYDPPIISPTSEEFTQVSFMPDLRRFGKEQLDEAYVDLARTCCCHFAYTLKAPFVFNGRPIPPLTIVDYTRLNFPGTKFTIGYLWKPRTKVTKVEVTPEPGEPESVPVVLDQADPATSPQSGYPILEFALIDTPGESRILSFFNGIITKDGGTHVASVYGAVSDHFLEELNKDGQKKVTVKQLQKHISAVVSCYLTDKSGVDLGSNTKDKLTVKPPFEVTLPEPVVKALNGFEFMEYIKAELELMQRQQLSAKKKKGRTVDVKGLIDANNAGKKGEYCVLCICEGDSAAKFLLLATQDDRDHYGILPFRGKCLNAIRESTERVNQNVEFRGFINAAGLQTDIDYSNDAEFEKLRYKRFEIAADMDADGEHIRTLIIGFLYKYFPSLLRRENCVRMVMTGLYSRTHGKQRLVFFHPSEHEKWCHDNPRQAQLWKRKRYKGLGSWNPEEIKQEGRNVKRVYLDCDEAADSAIELALGGDSEPRKRLILATDPSFVPPILERTTVTEFIHTKFVRFAIDNVSRMIPGLDCLKRGQRKIISACLLYWTDAQIKAGALMKTLEFMGYIMGKMSYDQGNSPLEGTCNRMVRAFPGSNNLALLVGDGGFEDRWGFDAAAARYTSMGPQKWLPYLIHRADLDITPRIHEDDGTLYEYEYLPTALPLGCINGIKSSPASGWSTKMPGALAKPVAKYVISRYRGESPKMFKPGFAGFTGKVQVVKKDQIKDYLKELKGKLSRATAPEADPDQITDLVDLDAETYVVVTGCYNITPKGIVEVTETVPGTKTLDYIAWLDQLRADKTIVDYSNQCKDDRIFFSIKGFPNPNHDTLKLKKIFTYSNMVLLESDGRPRVFRTMEEYIDRWIAWRLPLYAKRKAHQLEGLGQEATKLINRRKFVDLVVQYRDQFLGRDEAHITEFLKSHGLDIEYAKSTPIFACSTERIAELSKRIEDIDQEITVLRSKTPEQLGIEHIEQLLPHL